MLSFSEKTLKIFCVGLLATSSCITKTSCCKTSGFQTFKKFLKINHSTIKHNHLKVRNVKTLPSHSLWNSITSELWIAGVSKQQKLSTFVVFMSFHMFSQWFANWTTFALLKPLAFLGQGCTEDRGVVGRDQLLQRVTIAYIRLGFWSFYTICWRNSEGKS